MNDVELIRFLEISIKIHIANIEKCYRTYDPTGDF